MRQIAENIFRLGSRSHNFYLIRDEDEATLVDAGCRKEWRQIADALQTVDIPPESVSVVVTHAHADHFALARKAQDAGMDVAVHDDEETRALGTYKGRFSASSSDLPKTNLRAVWNMLPMIRAGVMKHEHVDSVSTFADGDQLDIPGRPVAIHTPGHTEGHTMFHSAQLGALFTGDGLVTMDLLGSATGPQHMGAVFNLDDAMADRSLDKIVGIEADVLLPGHGEPWKGSPRQAVSLARS